MPFICTSSISVLLNIVHHIFGNKASNKMLLKLITGCSNGKDDASTLETAQITEDRQTEFELERQLELQAQNEKDEKNKILLLAFERSQKTNLCLCALFSISVGFTWLASKAWSQLEQFVLSLFYKSYTIFTV
jgi:hypothetical protein